VAYLATGIPAVAAGFRVVQSGNLFATAREFGAAVLVLGTIALMAALTRRVAK